MNVVGLLSSPSSESRIIVGKFTSSRAARDKLCTFDTLKSANMVFCTEKEFKSSEKSTARQRTFPFLDLFNKDYLFFLHHARYGGATSMLPEPLQVSRAPSMFTFNSPLLHCVCCASSFHRFLQPPLQPICCVSSPAAAWFEFAVSA